MWQDSCKRVFHIATSSPGLNLQQKTKDACDFPGRNEDHLSAASWPRWWNPGASHPLEYVARYHLRHLWYLLFFRADAVKNSELTKKDNPWAFRPIMSILFSGSWFVRNNFGERFWRFRRDDNELLVQCPLLVDKYSKILDSNSFFIEARTASFLVKVEELLSTMWLSFLWTWAIF